MSFRPRKTITVVFSLVLAACGGGDGNSSGAPTSGASTGQSLTTANSDGSSIKNGTTNAGMSPDTSSSSATSQGDGNTATGAATNSSDGSAATPAQPVTTTPTEVTAEPPMRKIAAFKDFPNQLVGGEVAGSIDGIIFVTAGANIDYIDQNGNTGLAVPKDTGPGSWCPHRQSTDGAHPCFTNAGAMDLDPAGNLYVNDTGMLRKVTPDRAATTVAVFFPSNGFGISPKVFASNPTVDTAGNVYLAVNYTDIAAENPGGVFIKKITPDGKITDVVSGVPFNYVVGLRVDKAQNLYLNYNGKIVKRTPDGVMMTIADVSLPQGQGSVSGLVLDSKGNIYVTSNAYPDHVLHFSIKKISPDGKVGTLIDNMAIAGNLIGPDILPALRDGVLYAIALP